MLICSLIYQISTAVKHARQGTADENVDTNKTMYAPVIW